MDYNILQQEEKDWFNKAITNNNAQTGHKKIPSAQSWKITLSEEEFAIWKKKNKNDIVFSSTGHQKITSGKQGQEESYLILMGKK